MCSSDLLEFGWRRNNRYVSTMFSVHHASALIATLRSAGEEELADEVLASIREDVRRQHEAGMTEWCLPFQCVDYADGLVAFLSEDRESGLALLSRAAENGFVIYPNEAYLQVLYDDPGFAPILAGQQVRRKRERDKVLAIVCNDNPYAAVWQPEAGTCEQFADAGGN